ncbi:MAG: metallophosphoesterase family protein [Coriobacteriia bacterium]|nr:metallophosphoesterase family protein [Coriobacteriia bacterium]
MPRIGVISDTHGYLDPAVLELFAGVDLIIHAGDIGDTAVLAALEKLAPVAAVAGNLDQGELGERLPSEACASIGKVHYVIGHKRKRLMKRFLAGKLGHGKEATPPDLVVYGHEHQPSITWTDKTLFLNPGSASSPYEEDETPTVAIVKTVEYGLSVRFIPLPRREES